MPFKIVHNDITKMKTDAIVNAANTKLTLGGGVCGAIFDAAGEYELKSECDKIGHCAVGHAVITKGYNLAAKYIIHAVGPIYKDGKSDEQKYLRAAYLNSLNLAKEYQIKSISFPLISAGIYGYPIKDALQVALSVIEEFLLENEMDIYLVVFNREVVKLSEKLTKDIEHFIDKYYEEDLDYRRKLNQVEIEQFYCDSGIKNKLFESETKYSCFKSARSLDDVVENLDETFSEMLLRLIDEKGKNDVEVYKRANIDRKLFSKIRSNKNYNPKKTTAVALCIALELSLDETVDLLSKAGFTLSPSHKFDVIVRYFIENNNYDIYTINEALFHFDQQLLGV